jgi:hypothetical protein
VLSSSERTIRARLAANTRWSRDDRKAGTQAAREAFYRRFEAEVDPTGSLSPEERARRAESAMRAWMNRLALASAKARRKAGATP